ncbi:unnamed protein product [Enterobius vermicularis]|uniref:DUF4760 domain-containing protein n=1 Tax=Enterobius vermicularis TaxID=51028 RepID=A0A0N4V3Z5_ENTVE|nr:unnamed protein product [Enterobius vermicularis]
MQELDIDGYTVAYLLTFSLWILITLALIAQRQIFRFRKNNMRREQNSIVGAGLSKSKRIELNKGIDAVYQFQLLRAPKFTEIGTISEHANAPYIYRMIALDELREIDRQLQFINSDLLRLPGESAYAYLSRLRSLALPMLSQSIIERIGYLAEHCRFRSQPFGEEQLNELRELIMDVVRVLNHEQERLSALKLQSRSGTFEAPTMSSEDSGRRY